MLVARAIVERKAAMAPRCLIALAALTWAGAAGAAEPLAMPWQVERGGAACFVVSAGGDLAVRFERDPASGGARPSVRVGARAQPGSLRYLRVDRRIYQSDRPSFRGAEAAAIVAGLKQPTVFVFEWLEGPSHAKRGGLFATGGFAAAAAACERAVEAPPT